VRLQRDVELLHVPFGVVAATATVARAGPRNTTYEFSITRVNDEGTSLGETDVREVQDHPA
jgi:hypothetical protein